MEKINKNMGKSGKIKRIDRAIWHIENLRDHWRSDVHSVRHTNTYAELYDGNKVCISEEEIKSRTGRKRITDKLITRMNDHLHNKRISYSKREDRMNWLENNDILNDI